MSKNIIQDFIKKHDPDILCLNETKIDEDTLNKLKLKNNIPKDYEQIWNCVKPPKKGYAGTAVFTKIKPINIIHDIGVEDHDREGRTITLEFEKFYLVTWYVPNAGSELDRLSYRVGEWDVEFQKFLANLESKGKPIILCGDLNVAHGDIDIYRPKGSHKYAGFTPEERKSFGDFLEKGYIDTFRNLYPKTQKFSYWSARGRARAENRGWRLDYFVVSKSIEKQVKDSEIHGDIDGSDHCPISINLDPSKIDLGSFKKSLKQK